ncbi:hypothetical protein PVL29_020983 [Vitis rotundifolia]|uniref:sucrose synthase n=1 Tax=Vitis rotundifolia TaxID=103349 RepID=A0AA39DBJ1_VITRO|nr:hypothetical protein PVL29_020983 [Vitis rotundifolia]
MGRAGKPGEDEFKVEVELLSRLRSPYLLALLGYYSDNNHKLLVYDLMGKLNHKPTTNGPDQPRETRLPSPPTRFAESPVSQFSKRLTRFEKVPLDLTCGRRPSFTSSKTLLGVTADKRSPVFMFRFGVHPRLVVIFGVFVTLEKNLFSLARKSSFGQLNDPSGRPLALLGLPDTGGQIVYMLDQVRALENEMLLKIQKQGLDVIPKILIVTRLIPDAKGTTSNQRLERISEDASNEIAAELQGVADLIIGNYGDGNLVASLLSYKLGITQGNIAHALEKTKYP